MPASPALVGAVARALRVDVPRVLGQPYEEPRGQAARLHEAIGLIRRSIDTYDLTDWIAAPSSSSRPGSSAPIWVYLAAWPRADIR